VRCALCEAGHADHPHRVGAEALCGECRKPGVVVATSEADYDAAIDRAAKVALEASVYPPFGLTCRECETGRLKNALHERGACPACGKTRADSGFASSFCNDACRNAWLAKQASRDRDVGPTM